MGGALGAALRDGEIGQVFSEHIEAAPIFNILPQLGDLFGGNAHAAVPAVLPALVFEIRPATDRAVAVRGRLFAIFLGERAALDGGERSDFGEGGLTIGIGC